jgi:type IV fimbrial biogenesis protein FimT
MPQGRLQTPGNPIAGARAAIASQPCCGGNAPAEHDLDHCREEPPPSLETAAAGFTLIELMIGLAVAAVVLTIGVPSFRNIILDNRLVTEVNTFVADLNLARSEAIARNTFVTVKPLSGTDWHTGWRSFADPNKNGAFDEGETEIRQREALASNVTVAYSGAGVTFNSMGMLIVSESSPEISGPGTFTFCDSRRWEKARGLILPSNGRLRVARDTNHDKYPEDDKGSHLACPTSRHLTRAASEVVQ